MIAKRLVATAFVIWLAVLEFPPERPGIPNFKPFIERAYIDCWATQIVQMSKPSAHLILSCRSFPDDAIINVSPRDGTVTWTHGGLGA